MGKTRETEQSIDPKLSAASGRNLDRAEKAGMIPFMPNRGATIAAFTPQQRSAFNMSNDAAAAYGFETLGDYVPPPIVTTGGIAGHSPAAAYDEMKAASVPLALQQYIDSFFIDPYGHPSEPTGKKNLGKLNMSFDDLFGDGPNNIWNMIDNPTDTSRRNSGGNLASTRRM